MKVVMTNGATIEGGEAGISIDGEPLTGCTQCMREVPVVHIEGPQEGILGSTRLCGDCNRLRQRMLAQGADK